MIEEERLITYINSLDRGNPQFLAELEEEARNNYVPVIRRETQNLLKLLLAIMGKEFLSPGKILCALAKRM